FRQDLAVEIGVVEAQHQQLHGSDRHLRTASRRDEAGEAPEAGDSLSPGRRTPHHPVRMTARRPVRRGHMSARLRWISFTPLWSRRRSNWLSALGVSRPLIVVWRGTYADRIPPAIARSAGLRNPRTRTSYLLCMAVLLAGRAFGWARSTVPE